MKDANSKVTGETIVAAGANHSGAGGSGDFWWGDNQDGSMTGSGSSNPMSSTTARLVTGVNGGAILSIADTHACASEGGSSVLCWGTQNSYALGTMPGSTFHTNTFPQASVVGVATGTNHTRAIVKTGGINTVRCWGENTMGQLGNAQNVPSFTETPVNLAPD